MKICRSLRVRFAMVLLRTRIGIAGKALGFAMLVAALLGWVPLEGLASTTFSGDGNWNDLVNWSAGVPGAGDTAIIDGNVTTTNSTAWLTSYTLNAGKTHTFMGTNTFLKATTVVIDGTMTHTPNTDTEAPWTPDSVINIVADTVAVGSTGLIDADGKGYIGIGAGVPPASDGRGPGRGRQYYGAGGYGGAGGFHPTYNTNGGQPYGSRIAPVDPGSSGSGHSSGNGGGSGGGAVRIQATGQTKVDGTISMNGNKAQNLYGAGGSGGSVYIASGTFTGTGIIRAKGGNGATQYGGGGGGGRIAVVCTNFTAQASLTPSITFSVTGGTGPSSSTGTDGSAGTLFLVLDQAGLLSTAFIGSGDWNEPANWDNGVPLAGAPVLIDGHVTLSNSPPNLDAVVINAGKSCIVHGTNTILNVRTMTVSGTLSHDPNTATTTNALGQWMPDNRLQMVASGNVTISAGGQINVDGKGYRNSPAGVSVGYGPGGGTSKYVGGSYGGAGFGNPASTIYGSFDAPVDPGSGGAVDAAGSIGGYGGGAVRIQAGGNVSVNGTISADGTAGTTWGGAGGSGGGIYVECDTFQGSGTIRARGGNGQAHGNGGGGGGGRIAVVFTNLAAPRASVPVAFTTAGGVAFAGVHDGERGTLFLPTTTFFPTETLSGAYLFFIPGFTAWAPDHLTVSDGSVRFADGFQLSVTNNILVNNATLDLRDHALLQCGGDLIITNKGALSVRGGATNSAPLGNGLLVNVGGELRVTTNSRLYPYAHPLSGGAPLFMVKNFTVDAGGHIDADEKGYGEGSYYGPGGSIYNGSGAGYGGVGGTGYSGAGGPTYGDANAPVQPGSRGRGNWNRLGGGAVRVLASRTVTVNGSITANGGLGEYWSGGGSGGGIYIQCKTFQGNGVINAKGGVATAGGDGRGGGGGGGRIAIRRTIDKWTGSNPTTNWVSGALGDKNWGANGTLRMLSIPDPGTIILLR